MSVRAGPTSSRPLLVPAADILAKNLRAFAQASAAPPSSLKSPDPNAAPTLLMGLGETTDNSARAPPPARFRRATQPARPNPIAALLSRFLSPAAANPAKSAEPDAPAPAIRADTITLPPVVEKALPHLEKASTLLSRLPDPTMIFLGITAAVLLVIKFRPHWLAPLAPRLGVVFVLLILILLAMLWRRAPLFTMLRERRNPFAHPAEHRLDGAEAELSEREARVRAAQETLRKNRAQLDALRKELAKDPNAGVPDAVIIPSRKAATMIAEGALGAGYDADTAQEVEQRRREESVRRCREEWRQRVESHETEPQVTKESMKRLADHAHTAYTTRTRELKTRSSAASRGDMFINLKKVASKAGAARRREHMVERPSRASERSRVSERSYVESVDTSDNPSRRRGLFRRKRRETAPNLNRESMSESGADNLPLSEA